jgi:hypothetical protein
MRGVAETENGLRSRIGADSLGRRGKLVGLQVRTGPNLSRRQGGAPNSTTKKEQPWPVNGGL